MGNGSSRDQDDIFDNEVNLFQFKLLRVIGKGSFGKVRMVERHETGKLYALKYISKSQVIKMEAVRNILRERQILESLDHAFVVNMRFAFQDDEYMYMCMDLMLGGDLRFHMNRRNFGEDVVRFWIAEISSAVSHLHSLGIVHRDIKPDNVLLDEYGHAHLTDFNIGCKLTPEKPMLTSQSGTVAYMAPEVFKGTGYGTSVDWWAIGVLFYECIYNQRPFLTESIGELKKAISDQKIEYPVKESISPECIMAIQGFLTRDPKARLGVQGGMDGIRYQPFFQAAAHQTQMRLEQWWYLLETKQLIPKFQPPSEAANFDATYDLEELLLDEDPLTYRSTRKRAQRLQREKDQAIKEENERLKTEHDAALAAAIAAEAAMEAMNKQLEESMRKIQVANEPKPVLRKKKSGSMFFGSDNPDAVNAGQPPVQTQPPPVPQPQPQHHNTLSQLSRQTQFQSIPLSPIDSPGGNRELPIPPPVPILRFSSSPSDYQYQPPPVPPQVRQGPSLLQPLSSSPPDHPSTHYGYHSSPLLKPSVPTLAQHNTKDSNKNEYKFSTNTSGVFSGQGPGTSAVSSPNISRKGSTTDEQEPLPAINQRYSYERTSSPPPPQQYPFQAARPQQAISSPVIIPTPLNHSISRQKFVPSQQPQIPIRHQQARPRRPAVPTPAMNIAAAAAEATAAMAIANMSEKEKIAYQMDLIDREFANFDYTVYESYHGLVDPVTMSVGDPPEWVRSRDQ